MECLIRKTYSITKTIMFGKGRLWTFGKFKLTSTQAMALLSKKNVQNQALGYVMSTKKIE